MDEKLVEYIKNGIIKAGKIALLADATVFVTEIGEYLQVVPDTISPEATAELALLSGILLYMGGFLKTVIIKQA